MLLGILGIVIFIAGIAGAFLWAEPYTKVVEMKNDEGEVYRRYEEDAYKFKFRPVFILVMVVGFAIMSLKMVPANNVGIKYSALGGVQEKTLGEGFHLTVPFIDKITVIDTTIQERTIEDISIQAKDGERVTFEVNVKYSINRENAATVFKRYGSMEALKTNIIRNDTEAAMAKIVSQNTTMFILTEGRPMIEEEVVADLTERFAAEGVELRSFTIKQSSGSEEYTARMNLIKDSENKVKEAENQKLAAEIDAEKKIIQAQAEADSNEILSKELTKEVLQKMFYEKWNGVLPQVWGSEGNILDLSQLAE